MSIFACVSSNVSERDAELKEKSRGPRIGWDELDMRAVLGMGSFGCVRLVVHRKTGVAYALKGMHKGHLSQTHQVNNVVNEKRLLMQCRHPFIMRCHDSYASRTHVLLRGPVVEVDHVHGATATIGACVLATSKR